MMKHIYLLTIIMCLFGRTLPAAGNTFPQQTFISSCQGLVSVISGSGVSRTGKKSMDLVIGETVKTGNNGKATINLAGVAIVQVKPDTEFMIPRDDANTDRRVSFIKLVKGFLWARAKKQRDSLKIATPNAICGVRGTEFVIESGEEEMRVAVAEGSVAFVPMVKGLAPKATLLSAGDAMVFNIRELMQELSKAVKGIGDEVQKGLGSLPVKDGKLNMQDLGSLQNAAQNFSQNLQGKTGGLSTIGDNLQKQAGKYAEQMVRKFSDMSSGLFQQVLSKSMQKGALEAFESDSYGVGGFQKKAVSGSADDIMKSFLSDDFSFDSYLESASPDIKNSGQKEKQKKKAPSDYNKQLKDAQNMLKNFGF